MIVNGEYYHGVPKHLISDLEKIAQATLTEMFELSKDIFESLGERKITEEWFHNCSIKIFTKRDEDKCTWLHLLVENHSAGWWAIIRWAYPYSHDSAITDFQVYANEGDAPKTFDWQKFNDDWAFSRADLFWQTRRLNETDTWYAPVHTLDFKHPLLSDLRFALEELTSDV